MSSEQKIIRVGSRKSELALVQTRYVISLLKDCFPDKTFEITTMNTLGDQVLDIPLPKIGEKSLFTKELETALATGQVDFVVHSLKDLPTVLPTGMAIGAVLKREDPRDALVLQKNLNNALTLSTLPHNSVVGTSSLRRTAQLAKKFPNLKIQNIRGNINTRLHKLDNLGEFQAIILAAAGLKRIGWKDRISRILPEDELLYAVGQGALAVECRADNEEIISLLEPLYDLETALLVTAERSFLKTLGGGCSAPVAVISHLKVVNQNELELSLTGAVWSLDGKDEIQDYDSKFITVKKDLRCATCPYKNKNVNVKDIENLDCKSCSNTSSDDLSTKRLKLNEIPSELLKKDPHDQSSMQLPVGSDFMGQCPYLENELEGKAGSALDESQCPFTQKSVVPIADNYIENEGQGDGNQTEDNLFCGLVDHKQASSESLNSARRLGERLAQTLISKGALEIMSQAQAVIHGTSN